MRFDLTRRSFLKEATFSMIALETTALAGGRISSINLIRDDDLVPVQNQLLSLVNEERAAARLGSLKLDDLACKVAQKHALDMAENGFLSHWDRDGLKPYHRYSFAGGTEAIEENDGATDHSNPVPPEELRPEIFALHKSMYDEYPPHDGHRKTILAPQHTHVGFGLACSGTHVRLSEIYVARYATIDPYPIMVKTRSHFMFGGRVLDGAYSIKTIDLFYEPLPAAADLPSLLEPRPYGLPVERESFLRRLPDDTRYEDGSRGSIQIHGRKFRVPINASRKEPGIYTIVVWIQKRQEGQPFPATQACVRSG